MHLVHTRAARPRVDLKRRMELILWVPSENLALILWFAEWDPIFLSLANPYPQALVPLGDSLPSGVKRRQRKAAKPKG